MIFCTLIQNDDVRIKQNTLGNIVQKFFVLQNLRYTFLTIDVGLLAVLTIFFYVRLFGNIQSLKVSAIKTQL